MKISSGGRGKVAPYDTTHVRVPIPIKKSVESQIRLFKQKIESGELALNGKDIYIQLPIEERNEYQAALELVNTYMDKFSTIQRTSERNKALLNFQRWLGRKAVGLE